MDTFIVRIYRRMTGSADEPAGTVEHVESGERAGFGSTAELIDRLLASRHLEHTTTVRRPGPKEPKR